MFNITIVVLLDNIQNSVLVKSHDYRFAVLISFVFLVFPIPLYLHALLAPSLLLSLSLLRGNQKSNPYTDIYQGINGNVSLDRRGELVTKPPSRFDLTLDKSGSLSRSEGGVYDIDHAETLHRQQTAGGGSVRRPSNNNNVSNGNTSNGHATGNGSSNNLANNNGTLESMDGDVRKKVRLICSEWNESNLFYNLAIEISSGQLSQPTSWPKRS